MINEECRRLGRQGSAIRELFEYGKKRKAIVGEENVFDYSIGNPSVPVPEAFEDALVNTIENNPNSHSYTSAVGDYETRLAIANNLNERYQASLAPEYFYLTCGAAAGLTITLKSIISSPEDEIIVFAPYFAEYSVFIANAGGRKVVSNPNEDMNINFDELENKINEHTQAVLIDSPNNPTGVVYKEEVIIKLANLLNKKQQEYGHPIYLISDEPYRELIYSAIKYPFVTNYYDNAIVVYSFSKSLSLPGDRIGYIALNPRMENVDEVFNAIKGAGRLMGYVCAPALFQHALKDNPGLICDIEQYKENRDILYHALVTMGYEVIFPQGAFYMFVKALEKDANNFMERAKKYDLLLVPSDSFGVEGYVRLSYCIKKETIVRSFKAFELLMKDYRG